jgi:tetratricopeptide (TPR) repeat protein
MHPSPAPSIRTTDGTIAIANLCGRIAGLELNAACPQPTSRPRAELIDLLTLRAQILGRIADYERAAALAEQLAREAPADSGALLVRARARACLHRFAEALTDLETAGHLGAGEYLGDGAGPAAERAAVLQALGRYEEAMALRQAAVAGRADFETLGGLAALHADCGEIPTAERLFDEARTRFRGVSPFALAQLEFQRGHMWLERGDDLHRARHWLMTAWRRLPAYAPAEGHLAEVEAAAGEHHGAITRLRRLTATSDDPVYPAQLARILGEVGRDEEARVWRARARERYDELVARHPAAFADHAAEFWVTVGGDPQRARSLAQLNLEVRDTPRARALLARTLAACPPPASPGDQLVALARDALQPAGTKAEPNKGEQPCQNRTTGRNRKH